MKFLLALVLFVAACADPVPTVYHLGNGDYMVEYEGRQWQVGPRDLPAVLANLRTRGTPFGERDTLEWDELSRCMDAGGQWSSSPRQCYWPVQSRRRRISP